ncbi:MAG: tyrosine-protein phosphatase [Synergistaceae bacterium]|nr:tyrosine-protein phosphatase [Synergistaceae bacterium]
MTSASRRAFALFAVIFLLVAQGCEASDFSRNFYRSLLGRLGRHRTDYPELSDDEFANFRMVRAAGIGEGKLYRSSSPVSTWGERNVIADNFARKAGVRTFLNLADTDPREHKGYAGSYYSTQKVIALGLGMKYQSKAFRKSLAEGIKQMAGAEPPFLIHCSLGKDRAGFVCALVECLCGASIQEIVSDYLVSFTNYFGIQKGSKEYEFVAENEILRFLAEAFGVKSIELERINLADAGERYFREIGVRVEDIEILREKLK